MVLLRSGAHNLTEPTFGKKKKFSIDVKIPKFKKMKIPKFSVTKKKS